jgi:hypothetical protein
VSERDLGFQKSLSEQVAWAYGRGWTGAIEKHVTDRAYTIHSLKVMDALRDAIALPIQMSDRCRTTGGMQYLRYGAARRLHMMWYAYSNVVDLAPANRTKPLNDNESRDLTRDMNVIYFNMRGTLDNFAWALLHEFAPDKLNINRAKVGLFNSCITQDVRFDRLSPALNAYRDWSRDLAHLRDPSAHRIPLAIPPQEIKPEDAVAYRRLVIDAMRASGNLDFAEADKKFKQTERIGQFRPCFIHDIERGRIPIYPTLPEDVGHLVEVCFDVGKFFSPPS